MAFEETAMNFINVCVILKSVCYHDNPFSKLHFAPMIDHV